jgi:hypothetical protein
VTPTIAGFPFWVLTFDENGRPENQTTADSFIKEVKQQNLSDLFIFSHGWNNDSKTALKLYEGFFAEMRKLLDDSSIPARREVTIGTAGVIWPSIKWPDADRDDSSGEAVSLGADIDCPELFEELRKVFRTRQQQQTLAELSVLLEQEQQDMAALEEFKAKLCQLMAHAESNVSSIDNLKLAGIAIDSINTEEMFETLAEDEPVPSSEGGAAGLLDKFEKLWRGAKAALRVTTYWEMKERAGIVGIKGLGPLIGKLHVAVPELKVYLIGHSFGARLVSYALKGLPDVPEGDESPVKFLYLLQGAFSHFAFADALPFDRNRKGDLAGMASRVDGPLLATYSTKDLAVSQAYRLASLAARQDAADANDLTYRWQGMGYDGAQEVNATIVEIGKAGTAYTFQPGKWINLDGNDLIVKGGLPSGAHGDIIYPHTAWVALTAAEIK